MAEMTDRDTTSDPVEHRAAGRRRCRAPSPALLVVLLAAAALYGSLLNWGLPALSSWSQDSIAGPRTLGAVAGWPADWKGRYAPLHYLILRSAYAPVLAHWQAEGALRIDAVTGQLHFEPPHVPKLTVLLRIARYVSLAMALVVGWAVYRAARAIGCPRGPATVATVVVLSAPGFVYFARLGNVDVPALAWLAVSVVLYLRELRRPSLAGAAALGLLAGLATATKESSAGVYPGMAVVLLVDAWRAQRRAGHRPGAAVWRALLQLRWLLGLLACGLPYLLISGAFHNWAAYAEHVGYWLGWQQGTIHAAQYRWPNQGWLLLASVWYAASGVGWPMLAAFGVAVAYAGLRRRRWVAVLLAPALGYYLIVIVPQGFVYARFLLPMLVLAAPLAGIAWQDLRRARSGATGWRLAGVMIVALLTAGYLAALALGTWTDTRYAAEAWFTQHVPRTASVGAFAKPQYLPRLVELGYATYAVPAQRSAFDQPQPEYLVLTSYHYEDHDAEGRAVVEALLAGRLGYELAAHFEGHYVGTGRHWLGVAGWGTPALGKISPAITVLHRSPSRSP